MTNILIGPLKRDPEYRNIIQSYEILGDFAASPEILTFGELNLLDEDELNTDFQEIINNLPLNWKQDLVIFWGIDRSIIPDGLENLDCPVIGVVFNWNLAFDSVYKNAGRFDWIFTDQAGEKALKNAGINQVSSIRLKGFSPDFHQKNEDSEKEYDLLFVGNLNQELHPQRAKWVYRMAKLADKYKVKVVDQIYGDEYVDLLNRSKIVFNYSENNETNLRVYEITACGSLLFMQEESSETKEILEDRKHCVYYNENNFEELLTYYLRHDQEREEIAAAGQQKIQEYSFNGMFENLLKTIEKLDFSTLKKNRIFFQLEKNEQSKIKAKQALQSFLSGKFYFVEKELQNALNLKPNDPETLNNLGVIYANAYLALSNQEEKRFFNLARTNLNKALAENPMYALARFNLGSLFFQDGDAEKAEEMLGSFLMSISVDPLEHTKIKGFCYTATNLSHYDYFRVDWEKNIFSEDLSAEEKEFVFCDLLLCKTFEMLGDLAKNVLNFALAEEMYTNALSLRENPGYLKYKLAEVLEAQEKDSEALKYYLEIFKEKPLYPDVWIKILDLYNKLDRLEEFEDFCLEVLTVAKISPEYDGYKKLINRKLAMIV